MGMTMQNLVVGSATKATSKLVGETIDVTSSPFCSCVPQENLVVDALIQIKVVIVLLDKVNATSCISQLVYLLQSNLGPGTTFANKEETTCSTQLQVVLNATMQTASKGETKKLLQADI